VCVTSVSEGIGPRTSTRGQAGAAEDAKTEKAVGSGKATLRLKAKGPPVVENIVVRNLIMKFLKQTCIVLCFLLFT